MKDINIEFVNIQSHEHTAFSMHPGLNFILAEDNNVGKSTIFKVLLCAMQLPDVGSGDIDELIRSGCASARATFCYDDVRCTLWLSRENGKAAKAFFETTASDGSSVRSLGAPASLCEAFDIVKSDDGKVVNFNDADSVQLIVQDTPKNDEVLSKVLVDVKVDNIKANLYRLSREIQQDYKVVRAKLDDVSAIVASTTYVSTVDEFFNEEPFLEALCSVADSLDSGCAFLDTSVGVDMSEDRDMLFAALEVASNLQTILECQESDSVTFTQEDLDLLRSCLAVIPALQEVEAVASMKMPQITEAQLQNAHECLQVIELLDKATGAIYAMKKEDTTAEQLYAEQLNILQHMNQIAEKVNCPIKGEVFYSEQECVPCGDRLALRHREE